MSALRATGYRLGRFDLAAYCLYNEWIRTDVENVVQKTACRN